MSMSVRHPRSLLLGGAIASPDPARVVGAAIWVKQEIASDYFAMTTLSVCQHLRVIRAVLFACI